MKNPGQSFLRRGKEDGTVDSVCLACYATVAAEHGQTIEEAERGHHCNLIARLPELILIHDLDGELSAGVCSYCKGVVAEAGQDGRDSKTVVMDFATVFQTHVRIRHPKIDLD